jgi:L-threonylcarbamoyladenylate synthase
MNNENKHASPQLGQSMLQDAIVSVVPATPEAIAEAAQALRRGDVIAFPTETVYGLGANALDARAVGKVFAATERPRFNPLIVHVLGIADADRYAVVDDTAQKLANAFWPGPLSLVVDKRRGCEIADLVSAGLDTIALRSPAHPVARSLLVEAKLPIAAPSANRSGRVSPTTAAHVEAELDDVPSMILDGGPSPLGLESTVMSLAGGAPVLLRLGALPRDAIETVLGQKLAQAKIDTPVASPGQLATHYAPDTKLRLGATSVSSNEALLAFGPHVPKGAIATVNLSPRGDLGEAAARLFGALRELDESGAATIAVMPIPNHGLGEAINDRLQRASCSTQSISVSAHSE